MESNNNTTVVKNVNGTVQTNGKTKENSGKGERESGSRESKISNSRASSRGSCRRPNSQESERRSPHSEQRSSPSERGSSHSGHRSRSAHSEVNNDQDGQRPCMERMPTAIERLKSHLDLNNEKHMQGNPPFSKKILCHNKNFYVGPFLIVDNHHY